MKFYKRKSKKSLESRAIPAESEANEQAIVVRWLQYTHPNVLFCASAGGMFTSPTQAIKMKRTGYVKGFPDLFIYEPRLNYHGLAIEMKRLKGGVVSNEQKEWKERLTERGYKSVICKGADEAIKVLEEYLR